MPEQPEELAPLEQPEQRPPTLVSRLTIGVLLAALAFAITIQVRGSGDGDFGHLRQDELVSLLRGVESTSQRVNEQIEELRETRSELLRSTERSEQAEEQARKRADDLAILSGQAPAEGPGIEIEIVDDAAAVDAPLLLDALSELRDAGAEAIEINGEVRVVASTYFADTESGPRADGLLLESPITIVAIGDAATLRSAMEFPGGLVERIEDRGGVITITESGEIQITAVAPERRGQYAQPRSDEG